MQECKPFGDSKSAKVLVVGHDPRLQKGDTIADYAFFSDYFFKAIPKSKSEKAKYDLASKLFQYIMYLSNYKYHSNEILITNLCNSALPHAPQNKSVLIPNDKAIKTSEWLNTLLVDSKIELIFLMSQQVNYLLQKIGFYEPNAVFLQKSEPRFNGQNKGYYDATEQRAFQLICGKIYYKGSIKVIPIPHVKQWPLKGKMKEAYNEKINTLISYLK